MAIICPNRAVTKDKQLGDIHLKDVLEKRRLDQALNAKEFAVLAGVSYSSAREWFRLPGFPAFRGVVFWQDFVQWRQAQFDGGQAPEPHSVSPTQNSVATQFTNLPERARRILQNVS